MCLQAVPRSPRFQLAAAAAGDAPPASSPLPTRLPPAGPYLVPRSMRDPNNGEWMMNVLKAGATAAHHIVAVSNRWG